MSMPRTAMKLSDAAEYLGVTVHTLRRWINEGKLPAYRIGDRPIRVFADEVEAMLQPIKPGSAASDGGE